MNALVALPVLIPLVGRRPAILLARPVAAQRRPSSSPTDGDDGHAVGACSSSCADRDGPLVVQSGGWPAPVGITLVADRLSGIMLTVGSLMLLAVLVSPSASRAPNATTSASSRRT